MRKLFLTVCGLTLLLLAAAPVRAQERISVPFRDPSMPRKLVVDGMVNGGVVVTGYDGQEVVVEATGAAGRALRPRGNPPDGLRRIGGTSGGLDITEENNTVRIRGGAFGSRGNLSIQVPRQTSVNVRTMGGDTIRIENVNGEIEVTNMNGRVEIMDAGGSVVANSMNGRIVVSLASVTAGKPMSFSTMNGNIDVSLPAATKASLRMKTNHGEMYTDFDVQLGGPSSTTDVEDNRKNGGSYRVRLDSSVVGTINGGGPEFQFTTHNGDIMLRKK